MNSLGIRTPAPGTVGEVMNQIAVVNQAGKAPAERVIVLPEGEFDALVGRPGYHCVITGTWSAARGVLFM